MTSLSQADGLITRRDVGRKVHAILEATISAAMQCRHEENIVVVGELVFIFTFEFPIRVVDQDEDPRAP